MTSVAIWLKSNPWPGFGLRASEATGPQALGLGFCVFCSAPVPLALSSAPSPRSVQAHALSPALQRSCSACAQPGFVAILRSAAADAMAWPTTDPRTWPSEWTSSRCFSGRAAGTCLVHNMARRRPILCSVFRTRRDQASSSAKAQQSPLAFGTDAVDAHWQQWQYLTTGR